MNHGRHEEVVSSRAHPIPSTHPYADSPSHLAVPSHLNSYAQSLSLCLSLCIMIPHTVSPLSVHSIPRVYRILTTHCMATVHPLSTAYGPSHSSMSAQRIASQQNPISRPHPSDQLCSTDRSIQALAQQVCMDRHQIHFQQR